MSKNRLFAAASFVLALVLYLRTLAPGMFWEDSAAFQLTAIDLGIPHNPSFPIYLLISKVISLIPLGGPLLMVNLSSALFGALACSLVYLLAARLGRLLSRRSPLIEPLALAVSLVYATSYAVWVQAVRAEVYTLNILLTLIVCYLAIKWLVRELDSIRFAALTGLFFGLGLANHYLLFGAVTVPVLAAVFIRERSRLLNPRIVGTMVLFLLCGLSVYLYLPIRAGFLPSLSWGDFSSVSGTLRSILRLDEQLPIVAGAATTPFLARLSSNLSYLVEAAGLPLLIMSTLGLFYLYVRRRFIALLIVLPAIAAVATAAYAAEFSIYNLDLLGYLMPVGLTGALLLMGGFLSVTSWIGRAAAGAGSQLKRIGDIITVAVCLVLLVMQVGTVYPEASKRNHHATDEYARETLSAMPANSLFLAGEDNSFLPLLCLQNVSGLRPDVAVVSGGALMRTDYRLKTRERYPDLWYPGNWESGGFAQSFQANLTTWLERNTRNRPVTLTLSEWTGSLIPRLTPCGFAYRLDPGVVPDAKTMSASGGFYDRQAPLWESSSDLTTREHFGRHLFNHAVFCYQRGYQTAAADFSLRAVTTDPTNAALLGNCLNLLFAAGHRDESILVARALIGLDPENQQAQKLLQSFGRYSLADQEGN